MPAAAFNLPRELEATEPAEARGLPRDAVAMLVSDARARTHEITTFAHIDEYLEPGDLLVVNDSATLPAALEVRSADGCACVIHLATRIGASLWIVEPRYVDDATAGETFTLPEGGSINLLSPVHRAHARLWYASVNSPIPIERYLLAHGRPIAYQYITEAWPLDAYQTIFARSPGSVEMPSAARPFTPRVLARLLQRDVEIAAITLHCGVASIETHEPPLDERFSVEQPVVDAVTRALSRRGRIVAIGTTVVRALESAVQNDGTLRAQSGWTRRLIDRAHPPLVVDALLTGFHEPRATHLDMLEALVPAPFLAEAYEIALHERMLWHEFGDVHLIFR